MHRILKIKNHGHAYRKGRDGSQCELGLRHGRLNCRGIRIKINSRLKPRRIGSHHVGGKIRIQAALGAAYLNKCKTVSLRCHCAPVNGALIFGNVNSLCYGSGRFRFHAGRKERAQSDYRSQRQTVNSFLPVHM